MNDNGEGVSFVPSLTQDGRIPNKSIAGYPSYRKTKGPVASHKIDLVF